MFTRPNGFMKETYKQCEPVSVIIDKCQYQLDNTCKDYLKNYGMGYYYVNRIIRTLENLQNNIQTAKNNECLPYYTNPEGCLGKNLHYNKLLNCNNLDANNKNFLTDKILRVTYKQARGNFLKKKNIGKTAVIKFTDDHNWITYFQDNPEILYHGSYSFTYSSEFRQLIINMLHQGKLSQGTKSIITLDIYPSNYNINGPFTEVSANNKKNMASGSYELEVKKCFNIAERGIVSIVIPPIYFINIKYDEIKKDYNIYELLHLYKLYVNR